MTSLSLIGTSVGPITRGSFGSPEDRTRGIVGWPAMQSAPMETVKVLASGTFYDMRKRFDTDEAFAEFWMDRHFYEEGIRCTALVR